MTLFRLERSNWITSVWSTRKSSVTWWVESFRARFRAVMWHSGSVGDGKVTGIVNTASYTRLSIMRPSSFTPWTKPSTQECPPMSKKSFSLYQDDANGRKESGSPV